MKEIVKKFMPHLLAVLFFYVLTVIYFAPVVFDNKDLVQGDILNTLSWGKDITEHRSQTGEQAFWSNGMFSGMPHNYTRMAPIYNIFEDISRVVFLGLPAYHVGLVFIYCLGFYIFLISIGCKPLLSIIGSVMYGLASYNLIIIEAGHLSKALVMATMAPVLGGIILCYRKKYLWGAIITLISTGLNVLWDHQQISYYLLIIILALAIVYLVYAIKEKALADYFKSSLLLVIIALLALSPGLGKLITTADYSKETMRGGAVLQSDPDGKKESSGLEIDYAFGWSYGKGETMTFLIPNFYGASSNYNIGENSEFNHTYRSLGANANQAAQASKHAPMYWGDQPSTSGPVYMGAIVCFLFILGLLILKGPEKWWLLIATIVGIVLSWGKNFAILNDFLFYHLPLYNKFRTPSMSLVIPGITMATLAVLTLKELFNKKENRKIYLKPVYIAAGITGGLCLIFALFGSGLMSFSGMRDGMFENDEIVAALVSDRKSMLASDAWRSLLFIALAAGAIVYYLNKNVKIIYVTAFIGILVFFDLWTVDKRFLNHDSFVPKQKARAINQTEIDAQILVDTDPNYRVFNLSGGHVSEAFNEARTSYFHKSIGGYHPAKLRRYQDIIDYHFSRGLNVNVLNMLNTKYVITTDQQNQQVVKINFQALGNAWFVNELKWVNSPDEEIVALKDFNPSQTAFIDKEWQSSLTGWEALQHEVADSTAYIRLTNYAGPGNLFYESSSSKPQLAVFSEVYYKTWKAFVNGVETPLVRINYILRGLQVPAGNNKIEFKCIDEIYLRWAKISKIMSILVGCVLLSLFGYAGWTSLQKRKTG